MSEAYWTPEEKYSFDLASSGQLNPASLEGRAIISLLQNVCGEEVNTLVEIGTWNGLGSTRCILEGIEGCSYTSFHSLECNQDKIQQARKNLESNLGDRDHLLWGTVLSKEDLSMNKWVELFPVLQEQPQLKGWAEVDLSNCLLCPNVLNELPSTIDFLLLDGGEFTTLQEFWTLLPRCTAYIALDDIFTEKCKEVRKQLLERTVEWREIYSSKGRNGFSIFEKLR